MEGFWRTVEFDSPNIAAKSEKVSHGAKYLEGLPVSVWDLESLWSMEMLPKSHQVSRGAKYLEGLPVSVWDLESLWSIVTIQRTPDLGHSLTVSKVTHQHHSKHKVATSGVISRYLTTIDLPVMQHDLRYMKVPSAADLHWSVGEEGMISDKEKSRSLLSEPEKAPKKKEQAECKTISGNKKFLEECNTSYQDNNSAGNSVQTGLKVNDTRDGLLDLDQLMSMRSETDHASQGFRLIETATMPIGLSEGRVVTGVTMMDQLNESSDLGMQEEDKPETRDISKQPGKECWRLETQPVSAYSSSSTGIHPRGQKYVSTVLCQGIRVAGWAPHSSCRPQSGASYSHGLSEIST